jgi:hypothetical protein
LSEPESFYPLTFMVCADCWTFQSIEAIPEILLRTENTYVVATCSTLVERDRRIAREAAERSKRGNPRFVVEVGGADGVCIENFLKLGDHVLNIEPAIVSAALSRAKNIETINEFLTPDLARRVTREHGQADLVVSKQVLGNITDPHTFCEGLKLLVSAEGRILLEMPSARDVLDGNFYDVLSHINRYQFSLLSLETLLGMHGLEIENAINYPEIGGGYRLYVGLAGKVKQSEYVGELMASEIRAGLKGMDYYVRALQRGDGLKRKLFNLIDDLKMAGNRVVGFGAGIKASTLLNFCGLDRRYLDFVVDNGKHKQGMFMPGTRQPILPSEHLTDDVDYVLLLAWLYQDEILKRLEGYIARGGRVIVPVPDTHIVEKLRFTVRAERA